MRIPGDIRENEVLILRSAMTESEQKDQIKIVKSYEPQSSQFFGLFNTVSSVIYIVKHSGMHYLENYYIFKQQLDKNQLFTDIIFDKNLKTVYAASSTGLWFGSLEYQPTTVICTGSPGTQVSINLRAQGAFCLSNIYNFTEYSLKLTDSSDKSAKVINFSDPFYFNPNEPCIRRAVVSISFKWPKFVKGLLVFLVAVFVIVGVVALYLICKKRKAESKKTSTEVDGNKEKYQEQEDVTSDNDPKDRILSPSILAMPSSSNNFVSKIELTPTQTVTKRGTGELSFGPEEGEITKRLKGSEHQNNKEREPGDP